MENMQIEVVWGVGEGKTEVSAFDKALSIAGIHNYNLIYLSSIIPPNAIITESGRVESIRKAEVGDMLRVVISRNTSIKEGSWISTGLGWAQAEEGGIFIELSSDSRAKDCKEMIIDGANDMISIRDWNWKNSVKTKVIEHKVEKTSAIVVAAIYPLLKF